jgi:hypothetical protein
MMEVVQVDMVSVVLVNGYFLINYFLNEHYTKYLFFKFQLLLSVERQLLKTTHILNLVVQKLEVVGSKFAHAITIFAR